MRRSAFTLVELLVVILLFSGCGPAAASLPRTPQEELLENRSELSLTMASLRSKLPELTPRQAEPVAEVIGLCEDRIPIMSADECEFVRRSLWRAFDGGQEALTDEEWERLGRQVDGG